MYQKFEKGEKIVIATFSISESAKEILAEAAQKHKKSKSYIINKLIKENL